MSLLHLDVVIRGAESLEIGVILLRGLHVDVLGLIVILLVRAAEGLLIARYGDFGLVGGSWACEDAVLVPALLRVVQVHCEAVVGLG